MSRLKDWYTAGLARSAVELALDVAMAAGDNRRLAKTAFAMARQLLEDGCSTSLCLLEKARDGARSLGCRSLAERYARLASEERARIQRQLGD